MTDDVLYDDAICRTAQWFHTIYSAVPITGQKVNAQFGTHFEEVAEMLEAIQGNDARTERLIATAANHLHELANHLKNPETNQEQLLSFDRIALADSLGDQVVTGVGCGVMTNINMHGVLQEINRSNFSKFDKNGKPVFKDGGKVGKSELYSKPDLVPYIL